ncbi:MAG: TolC family protein [Planctomycetota bacterium]
MSPRSRPAGAALPAPTRGNSESPSPESQTVATLPPEPTVEDYVRVALERNPSVRAARLRVRRLRQRIPQVTSLDDPVVSVAPIGEMAETAAGQVGTMLGVSQKFPTPGKLRTRGQIAEQEVAVARATEQRVRLRVAAEVRRAYWSHYAAVRAIEVTEHSRDALSDIRRIARSKYESGTVGQQDVLRASVALSNLDNELVDLDRRRDSAAAMLNRLLDRPAGAQIPDPPVVELKGTDANLNSLLADAAAENPDLLGLQERIDQYRVREQLASLERWPDLTVSANYTAVRSSGLSPVADGSDQWWFGFTLNVPLWLEKLEAAEREAKLGRHQREADLADARNRVTFELSDALYRLRSDTRQAELLKNTILPDAGQALQAARADYRAGREDFLTVLEAWRRRLELELMYHQALARAEKDRADLEQIVGRDPAGDNGKPAGERTDERQTR